MAAQFSKNIPLTSGATSPTNSEKSSVVGWEERPTPYAAQLSLKTMLLDPGMILPLYVWSRPSAASWVFISMNA